MKGISKIIGIVSILALLYSCSGHKAAHNIEIVQTLPLGDTLHAHVISFHQPQLLKPRYIYNISDRYLIVMEQQSKGIFQVFSLPKLHFLYSWGRLGKGPNEFLGTALRRANIRGNELIQFHSNLRKLTFYSVTDTALVPRRNIKLSYPIEPGSYSAMWGQLQMVKDSLFFVSEWSPHNDAEYVAFAPPDSLLLQFGTYPKTNLKEEKRFRHFRKVGAAKLDGSKFVAFYSAINRFKIYNSHGKLLKDTDINDPFISNNSTIKHFGRVQLKTTDNFIYVMSYSTSAESKSNVSPGNTTVSIEMWDWNGNPVSRFRLDRYISNFIISEKFQKLYAFSDTKANKLYEYDLNGVTYSKK